MFDIEKLEKLKNKFENSDCIVFGCGPSLNEISPDDLKPYLKDKMVVTIKHSQCRYGEESNIHFFNDNNLIKYTYKNRDTIKIFSSGNPPQALNKYYTLFRDTPDITFRIIAPPNTGPDKLKKSMAFTGDFEKWTIRNTGINRLWGPGIMYETVLPVLEFVGVKNIYTLGWDYEDPKKWKVEGTAINRMDHYYDEKLKQQSNPLSLLSNPAGGICKEECEILIESSADIYHYLKYNGIGLHTLSKKTYISDIIPRVDYRSL